MNLDLLHPFFDRAGRENRLMPGLPFAGYQAIAAANASLLRHPTPCEMLHYLTAMAALPAESQKLVEARGGDASDALALVREMAPRTVPRNFVKLGRAIEDGEKITDKQRELCGKLGGDPVDAREFHAATLNVCLSKGWAKIDMQEVEEDAVKPETKESRAYSLAVGDATHKAILEPHLFDADQWHKHWQLSPTKGITSDLALAAQAEDPSRRLITSEIVDIARRCRDAVWEHKEAARLLLEPGECEISAEAWDPEMGIWRKVRMDRLPNNREAGIIDIKTTHTSLLAHPFKSSVYSFGYHIQAAFYLDTLQMVEGGELRKNFYLIAVTKEPPFMARVFEMHGALPEVSFIEKGRDIYLNDRLPAFVLAYNEGEFAAYQNEGAFLLTT